MGEIIEANSYKNALEPQIQRTIIIDIFLIEPF